MKFHTRAVEGLGRLGVGRLLSGAFLAMLIVTGMVGGLGIHGLTSVHAQAITLSDKWMPGVGNLASARIAMLELRELELKHSRTEDRSYQAEYEEKMALSAKAVSSALKLYEGLLDGDTERGMYSAMGKSWAAYLEFQQRVVALGRDKKSQDAADVSDGAASMAFDESTGALDKLSKYNFDGGKSAAQDTDQVFARTKQWMFMLLAAALLLCITLAAGITRGLLRQLGGEPRHAAALARSVAMGDLSAAPVLKPGDSTSLMAQLKSMQDSLAQVVNNVRQNAEGVATASAQIAQGNIDLSSRTEEQASALEETSASMEELSSTVKQNADNARQGNQLAQSASAVAVKGGEVVGQVVQTMKGINDSSKKIADIIGVIDGIAFQTNILALNAAVEAARAGEQGRGFAVVASEVRSLAGRSADAAREIKALIADSVERVGQGTVLVDQARATMTEVVSSIKRVTDIMGEISAASSEQSAGVAQVGEAVTQMDQATQQNAALVEESAAAAESLKGQAQQLVQAVAVFKLAEGPPPAMVQAGASYAQPKVPMSSPVTKASSVQPSCADYPAAERRSPNRSQNVKRLSPKAASDATVRMARTETRKTGTDDEWTSF